MKCQSFQQRLQTLLDSRQPLDADRQVSEHIEACPECATLAAAYAAVARTPAPTAEPAPIAGLADRVMAELQTPVATVDPMRQLGISRRTRRLYQTIAVLAASLLVAVGIGLQLGTTDNASNVQPPGDASLGAGGLATNGAAQVTPTPAMNVPGGDMWYRTGQGLASISLVGMRSRSAQVAEAESTNDEQGNRSTWEMLRALLPREGENPSPTQGETGFFEHSCGVLVA